VGLFTEQAKAALARIVKARSIMKLPTTILVATDFSAAADAAVEYAVALAAKLGAKLVVINAIAIPVAGIPEVGLAFANGLMESIVSENQAALDKLAARYPGAAIKTIMNTGDPRDVIIHTADQVGATMIVVGTHGRRGLKRALLGSVAESVVRHAHCPVVAVREDVVS